MLPQAEVKEIEEVAGLSPEDIEAISVDKKEEAKNLFGSELNKEDLPTIAGDLFLKVENLKKSLEANEEIDLIYLRELVLSWSILNSEFKNTASKDVDLEKTITNISNLLSEIHPKLVDKKIEKKLLNRRQYEH